MVMPATYMIVSSGVMIYMVMGSIVSPIAIVIAARAAMVIVAAAIVGIMRMSANICIRVVAVIRF